MTAMWEGRRGCGSLMEAQATGWVDVPTRAACTMKGFIPLLTRRCQFFPRTIVRQVVVFRTSRHNHSSNALDMRYSSLGVNVIEIACTVVAPSLSKVTFTSPLHALEVAGVTCIVLLSFQQYPDAHVPRGGHVPLLQNPTAQS